MNKMFLDTEELRELTQRLQRACQVKVLRSMGIEHRCRPDGSLAVLRSHVENLFSGHTNVKAKNIDAEPNWGALNATRT